MSRAVWLLLILVLAAALRLWRIDTLPPGFHFDEAFEGLEAWRILADPAYRPIFLTGNFGVPALNAYANALAFAVAGWLGGEAGPTTMRVTAALAGVAGVLALYGLAWELVQLERPRGRLSWALPLLAAASLALMRWHIHFSRMGIEPIYVPLIWATALWLLVRGWRAGGAFSFAGCGALLALGMYAYQGAWVIPFLAALAAAHLWAEEHLERSRVTPRNPTSDALTARRRRGLLLTAGVAVILVAPLLWFFWRNPDLLLLRPAQLAIVGETTSPADSSLLHNLWATAAMFGPFGAVGDLDPRRNLPGAAALNAWQALPFYLGLALALWRIRRPAYTIAVAGLVGLLLPGVVSEYAPHFHRVLGAAAPAALLCGIGLDWLGQAATKLISPQSHKDTKDNTITVQGAGGYWGWAGWGLVAVLLIGGGVNSARTYFVRWAALPDLYYAFDVGLWDVGRWIAAQPDATPIYSSPRGAEHATLAFAWRNRAQPPTAYDGRHIFPLTAGINAQPEQYAVIEQEDFRTPLLLPEVLPDASVAAEFADHQGQPYARVYTRPPGTTPARPPQVALDTAVGDGIRLQGYDVQPATLHPGAMLYLQLHWLAEAAPTDDWTVFTHIIDPKTGQVVAGHDSPPGAGSLPTARWQPGWRILDEYQIALPADLPPGDYALAAGLYREDGATLPADGAGMALGTFRVE